ncbi:hypothetical protein C8R44DRAFT_889939 [Mycena epipterygia]|nr:hypothetical protein C8R44DRAFT_889939 [Mycena epipterygia]
MSLLTNVAQFQCPAPAFPIPPPGASFDDKSGCAESRSPCYATGYSVHSRNYFPLCMLFFGHVSTSAGEAMLLFHAYVNVHTSATICAVTIALSAPAVSLHPVRPISTVALPPVLPRRHRCAHTALHTSRPALAVVAFHTASPHCAVIATATSTAKPRRPHCAYHCVSPPAPSLRSSLLIPAAVIPFTLRAPRPQTLAHCAPMPPPPRPPPLRHGVSQQVAAAAASAQAPCLFSCRNEGEAGNTRAKLLHYSHSSPNTVLVTALVPADMFRATAGVIRRRLGGDYNFRLPIRVHCPLHGTLLAPMAWTEASALRSVVCDRTNGNYNWIVRCDPNRIADAGETCTEAGASSSVAEVPDAIEVSGNPRGYWG